MNDEELAELDARATEAGLTRSRLIRRVIANSPDEESPAPNRQEALALLAAAARSGNVQAMVALERALRLADDPAEALPVESGPVRLADLRPGGSRSCQVRSTFIDDLANSQELGQALALADKQDELSLAELREMACGNASRPDREQHEEHWLETLIEALERAGVGGLERRADGHIVLAFADDPPTVAEAKARLFATSQTDDKASST